MIRWLRYLEPGTILLEISNRRNYLKEAKPSQVKSFKFLFLTTKKYDSEIFSYKRPHKKVLNQISQLNMKESLFYWNVLKYAVYQKI